MRMSAEYGTSTWSLQFFYLFVCLLTVWLLFIVYNRLVKRNCAKRVICNRFSLMIVAGSGGHTAEVLRLASGLDARKYVPRIYVVADTDTTSIEKIKDFESKLETKQDESSQENKTYVVDRIPRSREVRQSWLTTVATTFVSTIASVFIVLNWKPDLILCNGPGTCVPVCLVALIFRTMKLIPTKVVYVESVCRVYDLSLSGKILHRLVDKTIVQWPELHVKYPNTMYVGRLS